MICNYGIEEEGLAVDEGSDEVLVPECQFGLTDEHLEQLQQEVNSLAESQSYGIGLYERTLYFIYSVVQNYMASIGMHDH